MLGLTPGEAFVVGFVIVAVLTAGWWPRLGAALGAALSSKRGAERSRSGPHLP